jgi:hypothetical protein
VPIISRRARALHAARRTSRNIGAGEVEQAPESERRGQLRYYRSGSACAAVDEPSKKVGSSTCADGDRYCNLPHLFVSVGRKVVKGLDTNETQSGVFHIRCRAQRSAFLNSSICIRLRPALEAMPADHGIRSCVGEGGAHPVRAFRRPGRPASPRQSIPRMCGGGSL